MIKPFILISLLLMFSMLFSQTPKKHIAIMQLESVSVSKAESVTLTDRLRSELVKTGSFTIIERSEMDEILKEQGFQITGCTSDECVVEAGRLLNVNQICAGSIGKVGGIYTVAARLIDVQSGEIIKTVTEDCHCPIEKVLTISMRNVALKLSGRMASDSQGGVLVEGNGDIFIKSDPRGAQIYLDNVNTGKTAPVTLRNVAAGNHIIKALKSNYIGTKSVTVKANDIVQETITLGQGKGNMKIYSNPPEAEILIDGQLSGKTPTMIKDLSVGDHQLVLKLAGYEDFNQTVTVNFNQSASVEGKLKRLANLNIQSAPAGADIFIDGQPYGKTPKVVESFYSGSYTVILRKEGHPDFSEKVIVSPEKTIAVNGSLKKWASLTINSLPTGAEIFFDGKKVGSAPFTFKLIPDKSYTFKLLKTDFEAWEKTLTLKEGQTEKINARLEKQKGMLQFSNFSSGSLMEVNNKTQSIDDKEMPLLVGHYSFKISKPGFKSKKIDVNIESNKTSRINAQLEQKTTGGAFTRSLFLPGLGQAYQEKNSRAWLYGISFIGSAAGSFLYTNKYNTAVSDYNEIRQQYLSAAETGDINRLRDDMHAKYDDINSSENMRNIFYFTAGAIWLWNILDTFILPPGWGNNIKLSGGKAGDTQMAGISVNF